MYSKFAVVWCIHSLLWDTTAIRQVFGPLSEEEADLLIQTLTKEHGTDYSKESFDCNQFVMWTLCKTD